MGGGPSTATSQTTTSMPAWLQPIAQQILGTGLNTATPGNPLAAPGAMGPGSPGGTTLAPYNPAMNVQVAPQNATQTGAMNYLTGGAAPAAAGLAGGEAGMLGSTIAGNYLNPGTNPYLDATYNAAARGLTNQYQMATAPGAAVAAQQAGVSGGSADQQNQAFNRFNLGTNLSDLAAQIYGGNYAQERTRQLQAANLVPAAQGALVQPGATGLAVGGLQQGQTQAQLDASTRNAVSQTQWPYQLVSFLASLGQQAGSGTGQTVSVGPSPNAAKGL